jgi:hypothetical protein
MYPGIHVLWEYSALPAILPRSPQLFQNGDFSVLSSIAEAEKCRVGGTTVILSLVKNSVMKRKCETNDATASSFVAKVWGEVFANFHAVALKRHINK